MITFLDGPAQGQTLALKRAPRFLRVTRFRAKEFDALDQLDDTPRVGEMLFAYEIAEYQGVYHLLCGRGAKSASGFYQQGAYRFVVDQPDDATMRDTERWRQWCMARKDESAVAVSRSSSLTPDP
jgi:hypothetical protein